MVRSLLLLMSLLAPFAVSADGRAAAPYVGREREFPHLKPRPDQGSFELFSRAAWGYGDMEYRRAARVLGDYNPTSLIHLTIARP